MELSYPVKRFIEDNITLLETGMFSNFFYLSMFSIHNTCSKELIDIFNDVLNIDPEPIIKTALVNWCKDCVALQYRNRVLVSKLLEKLPHFGYDNPTFRSMLVDAIKTAYPNKTMLPDSYGIEYIVEKS